jgi:arabinose-5-phosphate isomerase
VAIDKEACPLDLAPTASTTACLAMGDALAMALLQARGFTRDDFARLHPAGRLGKRLLRVDQLMHGGEKTPAVSEGTGMRGAIYEMSKKGLGITAVTDADGRLTGCISDGDLRRLLEEDDALLTRTVEECMQRRPKAIGGDQLAPVALGQMEEQRITSLFVTSSAGDLQGIVHLHDLWGLR